MTDATPPPPPRSPAVPGLEGELAALEEHGLGRIVDALLKSPTRILHEIVQGGPVALPLVGIALAATAATGFVMALHAGGLQLLAVPLRAALGLLFAAGICLPSLYILTCLGGGTQSFRETAGVLLMGVAVLAILLVGFAPVGFVFSQATASPAFLGGLHLVFVAVSAAFGVRLVRGGLERLSRRPLPVVRLWAAVFLLVLAQLTTTLRPLVGPFDGWGLQERQFFLAHWTEALE